MTHFYTMDPAIKAEWVRRLRSGEYVQGKYALRRQTGEMCCLGVLSEQAAEAGLVKRKEGLSHEVDDSDGSIEKVAVFGYADDDDDDPFTSNLTPAVSEWAGLYDPAHNRSTASGILPFTDRGGHTVYLDLLNDSDVPFDQIADLIEYWY